MNWNNGMVIMGNGMEWSWFITLIKVEQLNEGRGGGREFPPSFWKLFTPVPYRIPIPKPLFILSVFSHLRLFVAQVSCGYAVQSIATTFSLLKSLILLVLWNVSLVPNGDGMVETEPNFNLPAFYRLTKERFYYALWRGVLHFGGILHERFLHNLKKTP